MTTPEPDYRKRFYDRYVSTFNETNASDSSETIADFARWADARYFPQFSSLPKTASILELGCGHGRMLRYLKTKGFTNAIGVDVSQEQVDLVQAAGLRADCSDIFEYLKFHSGKFDLIIAIDVVEHFTQSELLDLFDLIRSALKPSGAVLLQTVNGEGLFPGHIIFGDLTHQTIFNPSSMEQLLKLTGFRDVRFTGSEPLSSGLVGILRSLIWKCVTFSMNVIRKVESGKTQAIWTENFVTSAKRAD